MVGFEVTQSSQQTMSTGSVAIVIPCYNECATLGPIVEQCAVFGTVLVVDDGSTDTSREIAQAAGAEILPTAGRTGYDGAIEHGLRSAYEQGYEIIITIDADGEHDPRLVADFIAAHNEGAPLVLGIRPAPQRLAEWLVCLYCRVRFGVKDVLCGMKGFTRPVLENYFLENHPNLVNTWPALVWCSKGKTFEQVAVTGAPRSDKPRFQSVIRANIRIAGMLFSIRRLRFRS